MAKACAGRMGISLNVSADDTYLHDAAEIERLGFSTIWLPGGQLDRLERLGDLADATATLQIAPAITLLVTAGHTGQSRELLGGRSTLIVDQLVVLDDDPARARATARGPLGFLSGVQGYPANFARMGFSAAEIDGLDDRLVDDLVA